jgi:hypothetical protein
MTDAQQGYAGKKRPLPPEEELQKEIDSLAAGLFTGDGECTVLCDRLNDLWDELQGATGTEQRTILAEIRAIQNVMEGPAPVGVARVGSLRALAVVFPADKWRP